MNAASAMVQGADLRTRRCAPQLAGLLGCYWWVDVADGTRLRTFPDACTSVGILLHPDREAECFFIGPRLAPAESLASAGHSIFGIRMKPGAGFLFLGSPVSAYVGGRAPLGSLLPNETPRFLRRMASSQTLDEYFDALEELMLSRLAGRTIHPCVERALAIIEETGGQIRIAELASRCRMSTRHLAHLLRNWVGLPPKTLARVTRFQRFLEQMETDPESSTSARAADLGYFDQAHLTKEVAQFFGETPGRMAPHHVADFSKTRCE